MLRPCECNCGEDINNIDNRGRLRRFAKGHRCRTEKYFMRYKTILCACDCGGTLLAADKNSRILKFIHGHNQKGDKNNKWSGGIRHHQDGYIEMRMPWHPNCKKDGYIMEHIWVMSRHIKRPLKKGEVVHHINKKRDDNRIENLMLFLNQSRHVRYERGNSDRSCSNPECKTPLITYVDKKSYRHWRKKFDKWYCRKCFDRLLK